MSKSLIRIILAMFSAVSSVFAQDHLLITEFVVTPTAGEFVEIYNPTSSAVALTNYYLTDAVVSNNNHYINVVLGGFTVLSTSDFMVKFPDGTSIDPGQFLTVSFSGTGFTATYGIPSDFEILGDDASITDMTAIDVGTSSFVGLSNSGEAIILFHWDGLADLVQDVDYVVWGDKAEAVDKTGVSIDGPDPDSNTSTYANDTAIVDQTVVNTDNDADEVPHDFPMSAQRRLDVEDLENWGPGGNGITGHDETSENTYWKGGIWSINEPPTPGRRALSPKAASDSLTIADVNFVRADSIGSNANDDSPFLGNTETITGVFMQGPREVFLGNRWGGFVQDERGGPWSGFFVIQNDTISTGVENTLLNAAVAGDKIRATGVMSEFPTTANTPSITQFVLITDPVTPIEVLATGLTLPEPILLSPGDVGLTGGGDSADPQLSERWEGTRVRFENLTVVTNDGSLGGNFMVAGDLTGNIILDDYFQAVQLAVNNNGGIWPNLPVGTQITVTGFVRGATTSGQITINPRTLNDIEVAAGPPVIQDLTRSPTAPTSSQSVDVSATITSTNSTVASAEVIFRVDGGSFQQSAMTEGASDVWSAAIPAQTNGAFVEYLVKATDAAPNTAIFPVDTSASKFFYTVRDAGLTIFDLQFTPFADGNSGYAGLEVTVTGVVTTDPSDFSFYYLQDGTDPWSGIQINDTVNDPVLGDEVTVTGTVQESFGVTQITNVSSAAVNNSGNAVPEPVVLTTGELATGSSTTESYESMLVRVENITVSNDRPDGFVGFGEFEVNDGSGGLRIDDLSANSGGTFFGQTPSNIVPAPADTSFPLGSAWTSITGVHYFSFGNYKIAPRNNADIADVTVEWCDTPLQAVSGARDTVYICLDDVTGKEIISYQLKVTFNESVLDAVGATTVGTLTEGFGPPTVNSSVPGEITVGGFGTTVLEGSGRMICLVFDVVGNAGAATDLCIDSILFNAGDPPTRVPNPCCPFNVINEFDVSGTVSYGITTGLVQDVTLTAETVVNPVAPSARRVSAANVTTNVQVTGADGTYFFNNLLGGIDYTLTSSKQNDIGDFTISCFDAALTAQHAVGLITFDAEQQRAADVDEDTNIFTFDAALICRFAVGLPPFNSTDKTGEWRFLPSSRDYTPLNANQTAQDFEAALLGDVDGNWTPAGGSEAVLAKGESSRLWFEEEAQTGEDGAFTTNLHFDGSVSAASFELELHYDASALRFREAVSAVEGWELFSNSTDDGIVRLGMFSPQPLTEASEVVRIQWEVVRKGQQTALTAQRALVNAEPQSTADLTFAFQTPLPTQFALYQNYPNPFNPETKIRFDIPKTQDAEIRTVISIYNIKGQLVKVLLDDERAAGAYEIQWDGRNSSGRPAPSGFYVYRIKAGDFTQVKKMLLLR